MRDRKYVTMMDPFHIKYGDKLTALLSMAVLMSEVIWVASTLISLGNLKLSLLEIILTFVL